MLTFAYKGYDAAGRLCSGLIEAADRKEARKQLTARGIFPEWVQPAGQTLRRPSGRKPLFPLSDRMMFYRELAALLQSGVALVPALEAILQAPELKSVRPLMAAVRDAVREGRSLSAALPMAVPQITAFERAVMEAGERTGDLSAALERLASFLEEEDRLRDRLSTILIYPAVVVALALLIGGVVLFFLLPMVQRIFAETQLPLPWLTRLLLGVGRTAGILLLLILALFGMAAGAFRRNLRTDPARRCRWDQKLFALPLIGSGWRQLASLRFVRVLGLLLERGVGLIESVPLAGRASGSAWLAECARRETAAMEQGKPLANVIRGIEPLHSSLAAWVQAGEAGGNLVGLLHNAAERLQQGWERMATRGMLIVEVGLTLLTGGFVLVLALAILLPILQLNRGILP